jgi:GR25 family glycosyltransferase involved in LPS biosynthesis
MDLLQYIFYINLESRKDRLEQVQIELSKLGVVGERFNAIQTKTGSIGCTMSHIRCLELAKERGYEQIFICEDDICFLDPELFKKNLQNFYDNDEIMWDMLIVSGNNVPPFMKVTEYCTRVFYCQTTTGYIVKKHYYDTLLNNYKEGINKLIREPEKHGLYAIDMYWKKLQKQDFWYILTPLTVVQRPGYSDVEKRIVDYSRFMLDLEKPWIQNMKPR